jgi:hypothetical protein
MPRFEHGWPSEWAQFAENDSLMITPTRARQLRMEHESASGRCLSR